MKSFFLEKGPLTLHGGTVPLLHWKMMWGYMFPQYLQLSGLKLINNTLDLTKMKTV